MTAVSLEGGRAPATAHERAGFDDEDCDVIVDAAGDVFE